MVKNKSINELKSQEFHYHHRWQGTDTGVGQMGLKPHFTCLLHEWSWHGSFQSFSLTVKWRLLFIMSNSLQPPGLQHTRLPCPSPSPGACSNSHPLSRWCCLTISFSAAPFSFCFQSLSQHQSLFQWVGSLYQVAKILELWHRSFQCIFRTDFL